MRKNLIYFSSCAIHPNGEINPFLLQEKDWLCSNYDSVVVVSHYGILYLEPNKPISNITIRPALAKVRAFFRPAFSSDFWKNLYELIRDHQAKPLNIVKLWLFSKRGYTMAYWANWVMRHSNGEDTILYSYWMSFDAYAASLCKRKFKDTRFVVRGHAFDIDVIRNPLNPYLMKKQIADKSDGIYLISETAKNQYLSYMTGKVSLDKVHVLAVGSMGPPIDNIIDAPRYTQGVVRVISCSRLIEIKQVHILVEALALWQGIPLIWTHIGGGKLQQEIQTLAEEKLARKENVIYDLLGDLVPDEIQAIYFKHGFDVFINTSQREGVPVSIMEAMRHGIPAIGPNVGGIPEIITNKTGYLFEPELGARAVHDCLVKLTSQTLAESTLMREAAKRHWEEHYQCEVLLPLLLKE